MEEIILKEINKIRGIYILKNKGKVVYVGQTTNIYNRIGQHINNKNIIFDEFSFEYIKDVNLDNIENKYILKYKPMYNFKVNKIKDYLSYLDLKRKYGLGKIFLRKNENHIKTIEYNKSFFICEKDILKLI